MKIKFHYTMKEYLETLPVEEQLLWYQPAPAWRVLLRQKFFQRMILYRYIIYPSPIAITAAIIALGIAILTN